MGEVRGRVQRWTLASGGSGDSGRVRVPFSSVILAKRGSPTEGRGSTTSLLHSNQPGDSRAERENDSKFSEPLSLPGGTIEGILRLLAQALNDGNDLYNRPP